MRTLLTSLSLMFLLAAHSAFTEEKASFENRCGWTVNPTPGNWEFIDKDGQWLIAAMGLYEAEGFDDNGPDFPNKKAYWKEINGHHGYGCACMQMKVDREVKNVSGIEMKRVLKVQSGHALPLTKCREDKMIKRSEPLE